MTTPLRCKVCAKPLYGQQRLYCSRPCKRRAYAAKQKLREAQQLADAVDNSKLVPTAEAICDGKLTYVGEVNTRLSLEFSADTDDISVTRTGDTITIVVPPNTTAADVAAHPDIAPYVAPVAPTLSTPPQPSLPRRLCAYIQLLGHTLYHVFDGWRTK
jgi:hypothetical protein